jgi:nucleotide-binding universal stress UspA family protein
VAAFLRRHQVKAKVTRIVAEDIAAGELLLSQVADFGADLIVMGAYSRPRLTELVWGGVTRVMLSSMTAPVLMSH